MAVRWLLALINMQRASERAGSKRRQTGTQDRHGWRVPPPPLLLLLLLLLRRRRRRRRMARVRWD
jgi:MYXO-CTERM domain-containing protein